MVICSKGSCILRIWRDIGTTNAQLKLCSVTTYNAMTEVTKATSTCDCTCSIAPSVPGAHKDITFTGGDGQRKAHVNSRHF